MPKSKTKYKHLKDISRRHFNRLVKQESSQSLNPSISKSIQSNEDLPTNVNVSKKTISQANECESGDLQVLDENVECESDDESGECEILDVIDEGEDEGSMLNMCEMYGCVGQQISDGDNESYVSSMHQMSEDERYESESNLSCVQDSERVEYSYVSSEDISNIPGNDTALKTNCSTDYISNLANWAVTFQIKNHALNAFLEIQKNEPGYASLPKDSRTLVHTPRCSVIRKVYPGDYFHYGLEKVITEFLSSMGKPIPHTIEIFVGIDGLPISNSNKSQVWPILCFFKTNVSSEKSKVFTIGIYHGYEKPSCSNEFLKDYITEIRPLLSCGFKGDTFNFVINIKLAAIICDAPAKSFVLKTKGHTGFYSCTRCCQKGETLHGRTCFPEKSSEKRTHQSFVNQNQPEYHSGKTDLVELPDFDLVKCVPLEYMHLVCLGVVKKLLMMWFFMVKEAHSLPAHIVQLMSDHLCSLSEHIPKEFARKPRSIFESNRWKATELRQFLLYTGPIVLQSKLSKEMYLNFLVLSFAVSIMLSKKYHTKLLDYAHSLLKYFVDSFSVIYGKQYISHNVHALIHLKDDVIQYGPLDECSAFPFESFMFTSKKFFLRKPEKPLQQFARRQVEFQKSQTPSDLETVSLPMLKKHHIEGPLVENVSGEQYREVALHGYTLNTSLGNNCCKIKNNSIVIISNFVKSNNSVLVLGKKFNTVTDFFTKPCKSSAIEIF